MPHGPFWVRCGPILRVVDRDLWPLPWGYAEELPESPRSCGSGVLTGAGPRCMRLHLPVGPANPSFESRTSVCVSAAAVPHGWFPAGPRPGAPCDHWRCSAPASTLMTPYSVYPLFGAPAGPVPGSRREPFGMGLLFFGSAGIAGGQYGHGVMH